MTASKTSPDRFHRRSLSGCSWPPRLCLSLLLCCFPAIPRAHAEQAEAASNRDVAEAYLAALAELNAEALEALLAENAAMLDPTAPAHFASAQPRDGRQAILDYIERVVRPVFLTGLRYDVQRIFASGTCVVISGNLAVFINGRILGLPQERPFFRIPVVTILEIEEAQVQRHTDYVDYEAYAAQIESYRKSAVQAANLPLPPPAPSAQDRN